MVHCTANKSNVRNDCEFTKNPMYSFDFINLLSSLSDAYRFAKLKSPCNNVERLYSFKTTHSDDFFKLAIQHEVDIL